MNPTPSGSQAALLAPGRAPCSYTELDRRVAEIGACLAAHGVRRADRVCVVLPNGADMAAAFLGISAAAVCAPLNPAAPAAEIELLLTDLEPSALVVAADAGAGAGAAVATRLGVQVIELHPRPLVAGDFDLSSPAVTGGAATRAAVAPAGPPAPDDVALLLHTSGTTSRPKLVPLTHANLRASAANIGSTLRLTPDDRCLNLMPLFHIHGLVGALLASLEAGASVVCTPGFQAAGVLDWIRESEPSWYTAVPTVHQAMLDVATRHLESGAEPIWRFRFVRSSSAALPVRVMADLERVFGVPVIEAYGMTEAAHQIASNPLPPAARRAGTVGLAAGPEVAVMATDGRLLGADTEGELVIRGTNVMTGYLDNPAANADAFVDGWFRTGDLGRLDTDGYLTISGRLKEIINRGGENIAPREVDDALLGHPDVAQAVAFGVPHPRLGEEVAAAVVLHPGAEVSKGALRQFVGTRLAAAKIPRRLVVVDELPKGPSGKLQRNRMAALLGFDAPVDPGAGGREHVAPRDETEARLVRIVGDVLRLDEPIGVTEDFFDLGADSLHTVELLDEIDRAFGRPLSARVLLDGATVERMAAALRHQAPDAFASIVAVQPEGSRPPIFFILRGGAVMAAREFVPALGPDQPVLGIWVPAMHGPDDAAGSVEEIARECVRLVRGAQPLGPYYLFGHSLGGLVAYEMARQLTDAGQMVGLVALADSPHPRVLHVPPRGVVARSRAQAARARHLAARAPKLFTRHGAKTAVERLRQLRQPVDPATRYVPGTDQAIDLDAAHRREVAYRPQPASGAVSLYVTRGCSDEFGSCALGWEPLISDEWVVEPVPGSHDSMLGQPHVQVLAAKLGEHLRHAQTAGAVGAATF